LITTNQLITQEPDFVYTCTPIYENREQTAQVYPISYTVEKVTKDDFFAHAGLGTHLYSEEPIEADTITSFNIYKDYSVVSLIKTQSEGYIGYLEELIGVPFVLPPRRLQEGHQTDLRLGVDCAELAIYGVRRMGYEVPYVGPKRITEYLVRTEQIERGSIISFGNNYQISVVYEDRGIIGHLDEEDLLIHAYQDKAEIIRFGDTDLVNLSCKYYRWKFFEELIP
jgi:hypothetical protein